MSVPRNWRLQQQRLRLVGEICEGCNTHIFPPRDVCPECEAPAKTPFNFSGRGEVYSYSTVYHPPQGFEEFAPYTVALVQLEEGPMRHWLLWDREWMVEQLYNLRDVGVLSKISQIDTLRQFTLQCDRWDALRLYFENPRRDSLILREED